MPGAMAYKSATRYSEASATKPNSGYMPGSKKKFFWSDLENKHHAFIAF